MTLMETLERKSLYRKNSMIQFFIRIHNDLYSIIL